jgi:hypothetical protein
LERHVIFWGERTELLIVTESAPHAPPKSFALYTRDGVMKGLLTRVAPEMCSNGHLLSSTYDSHQHLPNSTNVAPSSPLGPSPLACVKSSVSVHIFLTYTRPL